jgi:hypothetical protein
VPRRPAENDLADHGSVEIDHEKARTPTGYLRYFALQFITRPRASEVGAYLGRGEQVDHRRTVPCLGLTEHEPLCPDRGWWPGDGPELSHGWHSVEVELVALDVLHHDARLVVVIGRQ